MHVLRLTPHFYWPQLEGTGWPVEYDTIGGMQTQIYRQAFELADQGVRQTVLSLRIPGVERRWRASDGLEVRGVRIPVLPIRSRTRGMVDLNVAWSLGVLWEIERRVRSQGVDVVHTHGSGVFWPLLVGRLVARRLRVPLVLTIHCSILATYHPMHHLDRMLGPLARRVERRAVESAARVIALTPRSRDQMIDAGYGDAEKVRVVPDCIDVEHFRSHAAPERVESFRERFALPRDRPILSFIGRVAREKGWRSLIELAERLRHRRVHFLICGDGNECDLLREQVRERGLGDRFTVTGYVPLSEVPCAFALSRALVLTSKHEEFGGVLLEAMAMGVPAVAYAVGGVPHVQRDGVTGLLVPPGSMDDLVGAVERLLDDEDLARRLGAAGREHVEEAFGLTTACRTTADLYRDAVEEGAS